MKKLLLSLIATAFFTLTFTSLSAQETKPAKKDTTEKKVPTKKDKMPEVPVPTPPDIPPPPPPVPVEPQKPK